MRPYVVRRDNDRSRDRPLLYQPLVPPPSPLAPPHPREVPRSSRKRYRISRVYLGMRDRAARNSIRRSRTRWICSRCRIGPGACASRIMRAYRKDDRRRIYEGARGIGLHPASNELHIRPLYASGLLDFPRESGEKIESRGRLFPRHASQFSAYWKIIRDVI